MCAASPILTRSVGLKIKPSFSKKTENFSSLYFQLDFDSTGAFINIVNEKSEELKSINYKNYSGKTREIIKYIENIKEKRLCNLNYKALSKITRFRLFQLYSVVE